MANEKLLELGKISGVFGVKGWVKVYSYTDPREGITNYSPWRVKLKGQWREYTVEAGQRQGKTVIAKLEGIDAIRSDQLQPLAEGEYYWHQLEGLQVVNLQGVELGIVDHMMETGANDVMVVKGDRERLIPFTQGHTVELIDLDEGVITVDWDPEF
jgi:16S rRNA processing protein RimM